MVAPTQQIRAASKESTFKNSSLTDVVHSQSCLLYLHDRKLYSWIKCEIPLEQKKLTSEQQLNSDGAFAKLKLERGSQLWDKPLMDLCICLICNQMC